MGKFQEALYQSLALYVRQRAWLNASPTIEGEEEPSEKLTREEQFQRDGYPILLPPCDAEYLIAYLFEIGPMIPAGMGVGPVSQLEIKAWQENMGISLSPWEVRTIRRLSGEYAVQADKATKHDCPAPFTDANEDEQERIEAAVQANLRNLVGNFMVKTERKSKQEN